MNRIFLENYRCFKDSQSARLAPLTLLVGENSTGKTSFLALIRALWDVAFRDEAPDFREEPYDLGTFAEVVHNSGRRGGRASAFQAGFQYNKLGASTRVARVLGRRLKFQVSFEEQGAFPFPVKRTFTRGETWVEVASGEEGAHSVRFGTSSVESSYIEYTGSLFDESQLIPIRSVIRGIAHPSRRERAELGEEPESNGVSKEDATTILDDQDLERLRYFGVGFPRQVPFAGAPVRSRPRRTYDPTRPRPDPEREYIPMYLASISHREQKKWNSLKDALDEFGQKSGLFDEISIKSLGNTEGTPFQVQVRKFSGRMKGPQRNLIDVGYGVSQVLPVLTELLHPEAPPLFLLQQPEVHLHPSAQAALGSLFCSISGPSRQLIVETHSDYFLDRVRMDIRDKKTALKPEDVSILYFERGNMDVNIHSLRLDEMGNVLDAPPGYRQFFMDEVSRSIGL